ncbi:hypothetical protein [Sulfurimonas sp.]|uniref:hypothetical protein n=1 Tax=Sulfurimonas sp. TaxID=2022749 RepID=UPI003D0E33ED
MTKRLIIALDGHDGAGKTTLSVQLANALEGTAIRPFGGSIGTKLMKAGENQKFEELLKIGTEAIQTAIASVEGNNPIILDRGWMTVASLIPEIDFFFENWHQWVPTALCFANIDTTLSRLSKRTYESAEPIAWHQHYLSVYKALAKRSGSFILHTDQMDEKVCVEQLLKWTKNL